MVSAIPKCFLQESLILGEVQSGDESKNTYSLVPELSLCLETYQLGRYTAVELLDLHVLPLKQNAMCSY